MGHIFKRFTVRYMWVTSSLKTGQIFAASELTSKNKKSTYLSSASERAEERGLGALSASRKEQSGRAQERRQNVKKQRKTRFFDAKENAPT